MTLPLSRRRMLAGTLATLGAGPLAGCGTGPVPAPKQPPAGPTLALPPLHASMGQITRITVCTRPFRPEGPRIALERVGTKNVVHNYGHGGSGWSLSWGSALLALDLVRQTGANEVGILGCGAMGLTTAVMLQRAGIAVTLYSKDMPAETPSFLATGVWSPDSRICFAEHATPDLKANWEQMTRHSFATYQELLGLAGEPVEWIDNLIIRDATPSASANTEPGPAPDRPSFATLRRELIPDLSIPAETYNPGAHPFGDRSVRRHTLMMFNLAALTRLLVADILAQGGRIELRTFHDKAELQSLPQATLVNCTGYGARALFGDTSLTPVRGQLARAIPQAGIDYGIYYKQTSFVPRRDGMVFQVTGPDDWYGYGDDSTRPDRQEAERAVGTIASLFATA